MCVCVRVEGGGVWSDINISIGKFRVKYTHDRSTPYHLLVLGSLFNRYSVTNELSLNFRGERGRY